MRATGSQPDSKARIRDTIPVQVWNSKSFRGGRSHRQLGNEVIRAAVRIHVDRHYLIRLKSPEHPGEVLATIPLTPYHFITVGRVLDAGDLEYTPVVLYPISNGKALNRRSGRIPGNGLKKDFLYVGELKFPSCWKIVAPRK